MSQTLQLTVNGVTADLTLRRATVGDEMRRSMLVSQAFENPLEDPAEQAAAIVMYPRCLGCVVEGEIARAQDPAPRPAKSLTPAEFVALPAEIGEAWFAAALELNPSWNLGAPAPGESAEKKDSPSSGG
jgi:hypothetical protein